VRRDGVTVPLRRNRDFVLLQVGQTLSTIGSESSALAYPLLVLARTHSPAKAGVVGFARLVPYGLFALLAGVAADRWNRKRLMLLADVVRALALGSIVVALAAGRLSFLQIALVAFVEGTMFALFNIAETGALRSVVPAPQLPRAAAAEQARWSTVQLAGPSLGGALFGLGRAVPFLVDAISYAFSLGSLVAMRTPFQEQREPEPPAGVRAQIAEGFGWLWRHRFLRTCAVTFAGSNFAFEALFLAVIIIGRRQGLSGSEIGALVAALGACGLVGSAAAPLFQRLLSMRAIVIGCFWISLGVAAFVAVPSVYVLVGGALPLLFLNPTVNAVVIGYRIAIVPDRLVGRVNSVARSIALGATPLGALFAGLMLGSFSARTTVAVLSAWLLLLAVWVTASPSIRDAPSLSELDVLPAVAVDVQALRASGADGRAGEAHAS